MKKRIVLIPQYLTKFQCVGQKCEDNCCYGWKVQINEETYKKYRKASKTELKPLLGKSITRNRSNPSKEYYAKIKMNNDGNCPFLDDDKLCMIQRNMGAEYLSKVCVTYPRVTNVVNGVYEKSLTLSCPEAARIALLNNEVMEFNEIEQSVEEQDIVNNNIDTENIKYSNKVNKYFWSMRIFSISIIQNRDYDLWERLIILGSFMSKVQEYVKNETVHSVPNLINEYNEIIKEGFFKKQFESIPKSLAIQMQLMKEFNDQRFSMKLGGNINAYIQCVIEFLQGINYDDKSTVEEVAARYEEAYINYYNPFMKEHEYILENFLVNHIFKELFPISSKEGVFDDYMKLVIHYSLIKMLLIGMSAHYKQLNEDIIIKLIYSFSRAIDHNKVFLNNTFKLFRENGYNTMAYMTILVKN